MPVDFTESSSAPKPKPAPRTPRKPAAPAPPSPHIARRAAAVANLFEFAQMGSVFKGWYADAAAYAMHGPGVSQKSAELAETNTWVAKGIDLLDLMGPVLGIAEIFLPLGLQLAVNHKRLPAEPLANMGVVPPATLEAQAKAAIARQQLEAVKAQHAAEAELEAAIAEAQSLPGVVVDRVEQPAAA